MAHENDSDSGVGSSGNTPINQEDMISSSTKTSQSTEAVSNNKTDKIETIKTMSITEAEDDDEEFDETLVERLIGLTEMFPESVRRASCSFANFTFKAVSGLYWFSRQAVWVSSTTALILFAPVLFEVERLNTEEMIKQDRNKLMLGPGTAMSGGPTLGLMPPK